MLGVPAPRYCTAEGERGRKTAVASRQESQAERIGLAWLAPRNISLLWVRGNTLLCSSVRDNPARASTHLYRDRGAGGGGLDGFFFYFFFYFRSIYVRMHARTRARGYIHTEYFFSLRTTGLRVRKRRGAKKGQQRTTPPINMYHVQYLSALQHSRIIVHICTPSYKRAE